MKWRIHLMNAPMGVFIGFLLGMGFLIFLGTEAEDELKRYGTYALTACVTLFASGVALATTVWNSETRRERKLLAAKSSLPLALSQLTTIARNGFRCSTSGLEFIRDPENANFVAEQIEISNEAFVSLKECIEHSDPVSAQWISNLIAHYQVYHSRLVEGIRDRHLNKDHRFMAEHAAEWVFWHAMVSHLFDFARGTKAVPREMDPTNLTNGFIFELAGHNLATEIHESLDSLERHYQPLSYASVSFRS